MTQELDLSQSAVCEADPTAFDSERNQWATGCDVDSSNDSSLVETLESGSDLASASDKDAVLAENSVEETEESRMDFSFGLEVVSSIEDFENVREAWGKFDVDLMNGFSWNFNWWKAFQDQGDLHLLTFMQSGETIGIAPFYVDRWFGLSRFRFLGSGDTCTDYVDVICEPKHYKLCSEALSNYIRQQTFDVVELECPNDDELATRLKPVLESVYDYDHRDVEPTWLLELPSEWKEFLSARRSSLRRKINKAVRRLESGEFQVTSVSEGLPIETALETLKDLHTRRMNSTGKPGVFADPQFEEFLTDVVMEKASTGEVEIIVASKDDVPVGVQIYFDTSQGYQLYQSGYAPEAMKLEPGHLLFTEMIKRAISRGDQLFDFLRGNEPYKEFWEAEPHAQKKLRMISKRLWPRIVSGVVEKSRRMIRGK